MEITRQNLERLLSSLQQEQQVLFDKLSGVKIEPDPAYPIRTSISKGGFGGPPSEVDAYTTLMLKVKFLKEILYEDNNRDTNTE